MYSLETVSIRIEKLFMPCFKHVFMYLSYLIKFFKAIMSNILYFATHLSILGLESALVLASNFGNSL